LPPQIPHFSPASVATVASRVVVKEEIKEIKESKEIKEKEIKEKESRERKDRAVADRVADRVTVSPSPPQPTHSPHTHSGVPTPIQRSDTSTHTPTHTNDGSFRVFLALYLSIQLMCHLDGQSLSMTSGLVWQICYLNFDKQTNKQTNKQTL